MVSQNLYELIEAQALVVYPDPESPGVMAPKNVK